MLSDACSHFAHDDLRRAVEALARRVEHYAAPEHGYDPDLIASLRRACAAALGDGGVDVEAAVRLLRLAEAVRARLDAPPDGGDRATITAAAPSPVAVGSGEP